MLPAAHAPPQTDASFFTRFLGVFVYARRALGLVWTTSRGLTVALAGRAVGISEETIGQAGAVLMIAFGLVLLIPRFSAAFVRRRASRAAPRSVVRRTAMPDCLSLPSGRCSPGRPNIAGASIPGVKRPQTPRAPPRARNVARNHASSCGFANLSTSRTRRGPIRFEERWPAPSPHR